MRYVQQRDDYSCGPVAILNSLKWAGYNGSYKYDLPFLQFGCRTIDLENPTDKELNGTFDMDFDRVIRYVGKPLFHIKRKKPTVVLLRNHLLRGGAICLTYHWEEGKQTGDHYCFIKGYEDGCFLIVNDHDASKRGTISLRKDATIKEWLKKDKDMPMAWFLTLKE